MTTTKAPMSPRMAAVLKHAAAGRPLNTGIHGQSAHGGLSGTVIALRRRGYLCGDDITEAGRAALAAYGSAKA